MSEYLISWLNEDIILSKKIKNIPKDFNNGYLFAELLYKTGQVPSLKIFKNSTKIHDILSNFSLLQHTFIEMKIPFNDENKKKIIKKDTYASFYLLHQIKQNLDKKLIDKKQLRLKNTNSLGKLFNHVYFKNDSEKYLLNANINEIKGKMKNKNFSHNKSTVFNKNYKSSQLFKEIKNDYKNLNLNDFDINLVVDNIEDNALKYRLLKTNIFDLEKKRKDFNIKTETNNLNNWTKSLIDVNSFKTLQIIEKNKAANYYRNSVNKEFEMIDKKYKKLSKNFDSNLQFMEKSQFDGMEDKEGLQKVIINKMIQKLEEKRKNKKQKDKIDRKRINEEQQMLTLNILNKDRKSFSQKFEKLLTDVNGNNKINGEEINKENVNNKKKLEMGKTTSSSMSRLTYNDLGPGLIKSTKALHWNNIKIGNRIDFFKTMMHNNQNSNKNFLPQIIINENNKASFKRHKTQKNIFDREYFFEMLNKEDYLISKRSTLIKLNKRNKKKEEIKSIVEQILDLTNYVSSYQTKNKINLLEDEKWKELMKMFLNKEKFHIEKKDLKYFLELQAIQEENVKKNKEALIKEKKSEEELYDYIYYIGLFNNLIIPNNNIKIKGNNEKIMINKEYPFAEIYSDFYDPKKNGGIDINEYEPKQDEINNLIIPQYPDYDNNKKLTYIIRHIIENEINSENETENNLNKKLENNLMSMIAEDKNSIIKKGKYFYLPIKICFIGYPMSGKKIQSQLIHEQYPEIKIYNPEQLLKDKIKEYFSIISPIEKLPNFKKLKHKQIEELEKQKEENLKKFEPFYNIISPVLNNKENENNNIDEKLKSDIYMKLLINELNRDFPDDKDQKSQLINELKEKYYEYEKIKKNINDINEKIKEEEKLDDIKEKKAEKKTKKKNNLTNYQKELPKLNKELELLKSSLFKGFIIINFPSNENEAKLLENYFTGYISEYEKEIDPIELEMSNYDYVIDYNLKKEKNKEKQYSFLDYIINLDITSTEIERRFNGIKYDPTTNKIYHNEDNPPPTNDKKVMQRLISGLPDKNINDINNEKDKYDLECNDLSKFYKNMYNGINNVYLNIDNMGKNITNINENVIMTLENIIFNYYLQNIEIIIDKVNITQNQQKEVEKNKEDKMDIGDSIIKINNELDISNINSINKESTDDALKDLSKNKDLINHLYKKFTSFAEKYKTYIKLFIQFILEQKEDIFNYLYKKQNLFIEYLNRKTNSKDIADLYVKKYNSIFIKHPNLRKNDIVYSELINDITDVKNSLWVYIQTKKKENVKYLQDIKDENNMHKEDENFWLFMVNIIEIEINKYLLFCEIALKYYLSKIGIIYEITEETTNNIDTSFSFDYKKILYFGIEIENEVDPYELNINKNKNKRLKNFKSMEHNFEIVMKNILKIIIKEDEFIKVNQEKITNSINKHLTNEQITFSQTKKVKSTFRKKIGGISISEITGFNEEINEIINKEKNRLKYRIMFLKYFSIKYINIINNCFNETFVEMDKWITLNIRGQNKILNEFISYLIRSLNNNNENITLKNRDFDGNIITDDYKKDLSNIYDKIYTKEILDIYNISNEYKLINLENLSYTQLFSYNLNDLLNIYNVLKELGSYPYPYIIKYNLVYELFIKKYLIQKHFNILLNNEKSIENQNNHINNIERNSNISKNFNKKINKESNSFKKLNSNNNISNIINHRNSKKNSSNNKINYSNSKQNIHSITGGSDIYYSENIIKGISKKLLGLSNSKYKKLLLLFGLFNNKYININELFTTLLIIGSELISSNQFWDSIQDYLPEEKLKEKRILLTKEEFMNIKFWFEDDEYLNIPYDIKEEEIYKNFDINNESVNNSNKIYKIQKIKESIFEINEEDNLFDIKIFQNILDKINKNIINQKESSFDSNSRQSLNINKNDRNKEQIFPKSFNDLNKKKENENKTNDKHINLLIKKKNLIEETENSIFEKLFLN